MSPSVEAPITHPEGSVVPQKPLDPGGLISESPSGSGTPITHNEGTQQVLGPGTSFSQCPFGDFGLLTPNTTEEPGNVAHEGLTIKSGSRGRKRKGEDPVTKPTKKKCTENTFMPEGHSKSITGNDLGEGMAKSAELKERAGKPTLSGRVPLLPTHLAEGGYQGEKKGVRGRKAQPSQKPRSKAYPAKPASKAAAKISKKIK
jgi:hypothetical protein